MSASVLALAMAFSLAPVPADKPAEVLTKIGGKYDADGVDISGKKYASRTTIEAEGDAYRVTWKMPDGTEFVGIGIRNGKTLSVSWAGQQPQGVLLGVMVYEIKKDGSLEGKWTMLGAKGKISTETLTPIAE